MLAPSFSSNNAGFILMEVEFLMNIFQYFLFLYQSQT